MYGQSFEIVYPPANFNGKYMSELTWDIKPLYYYGAYLEFGRIDPMKKTGFFTSLSFKAGVPGDCGIMEDRDWLSKENSALTHYSGHINRTNEYYSLDADIGLSVPVFSLFYIKPFISGSWMRFSFTGRDGIIKYARTKGDDVYYPIDDNPRIGEYPGDNINYTQNWLVIAAGFSAGKKLPAGFSADLSFKITPLTYCEAKDEHLLTNTTFMDYTQFGLFIEPAGKLSYTVNQLEFSCEIVYRKIFDTIGESYMGPYGGNQFSPAGEAGAGLSVVNLNFLVMVHF